MNKFEAQKLLDAAVSGRGFFRRGNAYFRIMGDGVLQLLKFEHERCFSHLSLCVGLYSMYSELEQRLFTSSGCIPQYSVMNFVGKSSAVNVNAGDRSVCSDRSAACGYQRDGDSAYGTVGG